MDQEKLCIWTLFTQCVLIWRLFDTCHKGVLIYKDLETGLRYALREFVIIPMRVAKIARLF